MELEGNELETSLLESGDDLADEASLDAVRPGVTSISQNSRHCKKRVKVRLRYVTDSENDPETKANSYKR